MCFPPTRKIISNERTSIGFLDAAIQPSLIDEDITIHESLYLRDFTALARNPPYQINITGVVSGTQPEVTTRSGALMRSFRLQDNTGRWVACVAYDEAAEDACIANGSEVIIFFCQRPRWFEQRAWPVVVIRAM